MIYMTADCHFYHGNIIKYCNRPFLSVHEMNRNLIDRWNERVSDTDDVYVLGDFSFGYSVADAQKIFDSLKGNKYLIRGNHDKISVQIHGWKWIKDYHELNWQNEKVVLSHYAMRVWNGSHKGSYHAYGHSHGTLETSRIENSCDVGVDSWNYYPVSFSEFLDKVKGGKNE